MAATKQTIQDFYRLAQAREFARDILFRVVNISFGSSSDISFNEDDLVYVKAAKLPGREIGNVPVPYMGLNFNIPGIASYPGSDAYELTWYADEAQILRKKFEKLSRDIFNDQNSTGNYFTPKMDSVMDLVQLNTKLEKVDHYQLVGVSFRKVGDLEYKMSDGKGEVVSFTTTLAYHFYNLK